MQKEKWEAQLHEAQTQRDQFHRKNSQIAVLRFALFILSAWSFFQLVDGRYGYGPIFARKTIGSFWKRKPGSVY